jgi:hypothetical protein
MPTLTEADELDFLRRQVLMSRNVRGSRLVDFVLDGLNYQIEHHLNYTEASLVASYAEAIRHLHAVGAPLRLAVAE